jgi:hypothetical protein
MKEIALHILDIVQNSIRAEATVISILIEEDIKKDLFSLTIADNGKGMSDEMTKAIKNPFVTSRTLRKVGLGIPFLNQLCEECDGSLRVESKLGEGTKLIAAMQHSHIDRLPLGDMASTITTLILAKPEIQYIYEHNYNGESFIFDTNEIKKILDGAPICDLDIIKWIGNYLQENIEEIRNGRT